MGRYSGGRGGGLVALETKGGGASLTWWVGCDAVEGPVCWRSLVGWMEGLCYGPHAGKEHWASRRRALTSLLGPLARDTNPAINEPSGACPYPKPGRVLHTPYSAVPCCCNNAYQKLSSPPLVPAHGQQATPPTALLPSRPGASQTETVTALHRQVEPASCSAVGSMDASIRTEMQLRGRHRRQGARRTVRRFMHSCIHTTQAVHFT